MTASHAGGLRRPGFQSHSSSDMLTIEPWVWVGRSGLEDTIPGDAPPLCVNSPLPIACPLPPTPHADHTTVCTRLPEPWVEWARRS